MDSDYLRNHLGSCLKEALGEVVEKRPHDPIEYLAQYLYKYQENELYNRKLAQAARDAEEEKSEFVAENETERICGVERKIIKKLEPELINPPKKDEEEEEPTPVISQEFVNMQATIATGGIERRPNSQSSVASSDMTSRSIDADEDLAPVPPLVMEHANTIVADVIASGVLTASLDSSDLPTPRHSLGSPEKASPKQLTPRLEEANNHLGLEDNVDEERGTTVMFATGAADSIAESTELPDLADSITEDAKSPEPTAEVAKSPEPVAEVSKSPEPLAEVSKSPEPVAEVSKSPEPVAEVSTSPEPVAEVSKSPEPVAEVSKSPEPAAEVSKSPEPVAEVSKSPEPAAEVSKSPEPVAEVSKSPEPAAEVSKSPEPVAEVSKSPEPAAEISKSPEPVAEISKSPEPVAVEEPVIEVVAEEDQSRGFVTHKEFAVDDEEEVEAPPVSDVAAPAVKLSMELEVKEEDGKPLTKAAAYEQDNETSEATAPAPSPLSSPAPTPAPSVEPTAPLTPTKESSAPSKLPSQSVLSFEANEKIVESLVDQDDEQEATADEND